MTNLKAMAATALLAASAFPAMAGTLHCSFTEPFFVIDFDSATKIVTLTSPDETDPDTGAMKPRMLGEGARIRRSGVWDTFDTFFLETPGRTPKDEPTVIVELQATGRGSDGMSEHVFPFEGRYGSNIGGCASDKAPGYDAYAVYEDLGVVNTPPP